MSSSLLCKTIMTEVYCINIVLLVLYGCKTSLCAEGEQIESVREEGSEESN